MYYVFFRARKKGNSNSTAETKIDSLIQQMTIEEKAGQLNLQVGDSFNTGPTVNTTESARFDEMIRKGKITGLFNVHGAKYTARLQKIAVEESRLHIPLLFGADVIHGFKTVMPLPLAEAASWDLAAIENSARVAAIESTAAGINFNFAPVVDISRDPRWGRISEGAGEDPYLGSLIAAARVKGFQGKSLSDPTTLAACVKHFAAYGAPFAGREYNTVDMSLQSLNETYFPPYKAAVEAGSATVMNSFNELNGIPATANKYLLQEVLRKQWNFKGMVVSDWQSIGEIMPHGFAADSIQAGKLALEAGTDMDMMSAIYLKKIPEMVKKGIVDEKLVNEAVRRVLKLKFDLGLFDNPYLYSDVEREKKDIRSDANLQAAHDMARKSIVLLKNDGRLLPLKKNIKKIAVIGPLANSKEDMNGSWSFFGDVKDPISILEGLQSKVDKSTIITYAQGCNLFDDKKDLFAQAEQVARQADIVIMALGESAAMNGEAASRSDIGLPGVQQELLEAIHKTGKPIVVLLLNGRPLAIEWMDQNIPAILETWTLGSQAGTAIAEVVFGEYNPSGKLPVTFPRSVGQIPIFYNHKHGGRPYEGDYSEPLSTRIYKSKYQDVKNTPLYVFGYGLSYATFEYSNLKLSTTKLKSSEKLTVEVTVKNTSSVEGEEVIQLYIRDMVGSITRPIKELKDFQKMFFKAGEEKTLKFVIDKEDLSFFQADLKWGTEPGSFKIMVGTNSDQTIDQSFDLID